MLADTPAEPTFDRLTLLVAELLKVDVSLISLVDERRQFFKSQVGLPEPVATARETPLSHSICQHVVAHARPLIISDTREDERVKENLAVKELGVVAYAGAPIFDADGKAIGALCAIDAHPRSWTLDEVMVIQTLAEQASNEIATRELVLRLGDDLASMRAADQLRGRMARADRHDLRTPLNALKLSLQAVEQFGDLNEDQTESLQIAHRTADEIMEMVDRMVDIGQVDALGKEVLHRSPSTLNELLERARVQVAPLILEKKLRLTVRIPKETPVLVDIDKIVRVFVNLLSNAVKFTAPDGTIEVVCLGHSEDGSLHLSIRDSGIGMDRESLSRLFTEGYHADVSAPTRRSSGLGLTFCERVMEAHGGRISVSSKKGEGSTFYLIFPPSAE